MVIALPLFLERMSGLLPAEKKLVLLNTLLQREPFEISFLLNCDNICDDFHEDIETGILEERSNFFPYAIFAPLAYLSQQVSMLYMIVLQAMVIFN
jgi:hypothetical protein